MKSLKETKVLIAGVPTLGYINVDKILYAAEYEGVIYATMDNGDKVEFDPQDWAQLYIANYR